MRHHPQGPLSVTPATGEILGKTVTKLGEVLLVEVQVKMAEDSILEKVQGQSLAVGNPPPLKLRRTLLRRAGRKGGGLKTR
ncbi:MAG TPA: hypothetical protein DDW31_09040 [candidate division Zixibacteria bacterium]|nr:hypothetical protein [candidate division Zixibacteria bacterium]